MKPHIPLYFLAGLILSCNQTKETKKSVLDSPPVSELSGNGLAHIHCASCHSFVSPETLSKPIWKNDVLPAMGNRLGIFDGEHQPDSIFGSFRNASIVKKANVFPEEPVLAREDWMKIVAFTCKHPGYGSSPETQYHDFQQLKILQFQGTCNFLRVR